MWRKLVVLFYVAILGITWLQLLWFFGYPVVGGLILTPSAHPYLPPMTLIITVPANTCQGWSVKMVPAKWLGLDIYLPVVHYFEGGYEMANYFPLDAGLPDVIFNYFKALISPYWVAIPAHNAKCVARVVAYVPGPLILAAMIVALTTKLWYGFRRVW